MAQDEQPDRRDEQSDVVHPNAIEHPERARPQPDATRLDPAQQLDPAQLEQFRQFQQFQEFLKFSEAQHGAQPPGQPPGQHHAPGQPTTGTPPPSSPVPPPPQPERPRERRPRTPLWRTLLRSKIFRRLVYVLLALLALNLAYQHYFGEEDSDRAAETGGGKTRTNLVLPNTPTETVRVLYEGVGSSNPDSPAESCQLFTAQAAKSFASHMHAATCPIAIKQLNDKVTSKSQYGDMTFPSAMMHPKGNTTRISSCELEVQGGERLGEFTLRKISLGQWIITAHQREPEPCPSTAGSTEPTY